MLTLPSPSWHLPECLTRAEQEVAKAILGGATNEQIAERRSISVRTVAHQIGSIFEKLAVSSRAEFASLLATRQEARPREAIVAMTDTLLYPAETLRPHD